MLDETTGKDFEEHILLEQIKDLSKNKDYLNQIVKKLSSRFDIYIEMKFVNFVLDEFNYNDFTFEVTNPDFSFDLEKYFLMKYLYSVLLRADKLSAAEIPINSSAPEAILFFQIKLPSFAFKA